MNLKACFDIDLGVPAMLPLVKPNMHAAHEKTCCDHITAAVVCVPRPHCSIGRLSLFNMHPFEYTGKLKWQQ